jgi:hypothetical protein
MTDYPAPLRRMGNAPLRYGPLPLRLFRMRMQAPLMADVTLTITLSDIEAHALAIITASLGPEQFEHAYQHWLSHWKAHEQLLDKLHSQYLRWPAA